MSVSCQCQCLSPDKLGVVTINHIRPMLPPVSMQQVVMKSAGWRRAAGGWDEPAIQSGPACSRLGRCLLRPWYCLSCCLLVFLNGRRKSWTSTLQSHPEMASCLPRSLKHIPYMYCVCRPPSLLEREIPNRDTDSPPPSRAGVIFPVSVGAVSPIGNWFHCPRVFRGFKGGSGVMAGTMDIVSTCSWLHRPSPRTHLNARPRALFLFRLLTYR